MNAFSCNCSRGSNLQWFSDKTLSFITNGKPTFEIPLGDIAQATADAKKSEVTVQFPQDEGSDTVSIY